MYYTNADIIPAANRGLTRETPNGNFSTMKREGWQRHGLSYTGHLPEPLRVAFFQLAAEGWTFEQVVYSYSTPIAILMTDGDHSAWIVPSVTYSATTSKRHANRLYGLNGIVRSVPWDATAEDIARVGRGLMVYSGPRTRGGVGSWSPGLEWTPGA